MTRHHGDSARDSPRHPGGDRQPWLIVIAASAGGVHALRTVLGALSADLPAAVIVVLHRPPHGESYVREVLARSTGLTVCMAEEGGAIQPGTVYVAEADAHLTVTPHERFRYRDGTRIRFLRSSANPLLESAAAAAGSRLVAVVLTGTGSDGTDGVQAVKAHGGTVVVQDPLSAQFSGMPEAAVESGAADFIMPLEAIGPVLNDIVHGRAVHA